jgi:post-segregation antitoxin (ccd killing protein)
LEYREPRFYPFDSLGGMYVHTSYASFASNIGSFGNYGFEMSALMEATIAKQIAREKQITSILQEIFGEQASLKQFAEWFRSPDGYFERYKKQVYNTFIEEQETLPKFGLVWSRAQYDKPKIGAKKLEVLLNKVMQSLEQVAPDGYINLEQLKAAKTHILKGITSLSQQPGDTSQQIIARQVQSIKGFIWEMYLARVAIAALKVMGANKNFTVLLQGTGNVADIAVDLGNTTLGINVKSASTSTFAGKHGITLFSNSTINGIVKAMAAYANSDTLEAFKYYLINISRMKTHPLSGVSAQGIGHSQAGLNLIKSTLTAYATIFIGEGSNLANTDNNQIKQADVLFTADRVYLKSELLRELASGNNPDVGNLETFLRISYSSANDWEQFDIIKRRVMEFEKGDYSSAMKRGYMTSAVNSLLAQTASVKLRLLK